MAAAPVIESAAEFVRLRTSDDETEYHRAAHDEAPLEVWRDVIDRFPDMRFWVAHNKTVPTEILDVLARDADPRVRFMVAEKRRATPEQLLLLSGDEDEGVRIRVARNARTDPELLRVLAEDPSWAVRAAALDRLGTNLPVAQAEGGMTGESAIPPA